MYWVRRGLIWVRGADAGDDLMRRQGILTLVTWHDVTREHTTVQRLRELASRTSTESIILLASSMSTILANRRQVTLQERVNDQISGAMELLPSPVKDSVIRMLHQGTHHVWYHDEQLLVAAKFALLYGRGGGERAWDKAIAAEFLLGINDILGSAAEAASRSPNEEDRQLLAFIIRRLGLLQNEAPRYLIGRYFNLLVTRARALAAPVNLNDAFVAATGIEIEQFFAYALIFSACFAQFSSAQTLQEADFSGIGRRVEASIRDAQLRERIGRLLVTDAASLNERFDAERGAPTIALSRLLPFQQTPLFRLSSGSLVPLIYPFALDKASLGIYWILQDHFARSDPDHGVQTFRAVVGRLHQDYVTELLSRTHATGKASFHPESELRGPLPPPREREGLPDGLLIEGDSAVVFEMSVTALTYGVLLSGNTDKFKRETAEKFRPKFEQLKQSIDDIVEGRSSCPGMRREAIRHIFPVLILLFPFPQQLLTWKLLEGIIQSGHQRSEDGMARFEVHHPQIITNEELEMLEPQIREDAYSLVRLLSRKVASPASRYISMKNFLFLFESTKEKGNPAMLGLYTTATDRAKEILRTELLLG